MAIEMTPEEIEAIFQEYNDAVARGIPIEEDLAERMKDASAGLRGYTAELKNSLNNLKTSTAGTVKALIAGQQGASVYNNSIESGADLLGTFLKKLGPVGKFFGALVGLTAKLVSEVNIQTDALYKSYQDLSKFGAGVTTGVEGVLGLSQEMGYTRETLSSFSSTIERSSKQLAMLGGTVSQGTADFARLVNSVSDQREMWRRMGLDVDAQNEAYGGFIRIMTTSGRLQTMTDLERGPASQAYLDGLVTLGKLTGQTADELQTQREALLSQQRFASTQRELEKKAKDAERAGDEEAAKRYRTQADQNFKLINAVPEELRTGVADLMTGYVGTSEAATEIYRGLPGMARMIMGQSYDFAEVMATGEKEASKRLDAFGKTLGGTGAFDESFGSLIGYVKLESAAAKQSFTDRLITAKGEIEAQRNLQGATADQAAMRESQLRTAQNAQAVIGVFTGPVTSAMSKLATATGEAATALGRVAGTNQRGAPAGPGANPGAGGGAGAGATTAPAPTAEAQVLQAYLANQGMGPTPAPATAPAQPTTAEQDFLAAYGVTLATTAAKPKPQAEQTSNAVKVSAQKAQTTAPESAPADANTAKPADGKEYKVNNRVVDKATYDRQQAAMKAMGKEGLLKVLQDKEAKDKTPDVNLINLTPKMASGGIATGPTSGYQAMLHGIEAVVPLPGNKSIPVSMPAMTGINQEQIQIFDQQMSKLDELIKETRTNNQLTQKMLKIAQG